MALDMWPTPNATDARSWSYDESRQSGKCLEALARTGKLSMYTTPCASDAIGTNGGGNSASLRTDIGGRLNPDWVDWLVGLPVSYTDIEKDMQIPKFDAHHFDAEPENIPRVAPRGNKNRVPRLIGDGNIAVPQQFYPVFKAIAEIERLKL